MQVTEFPSVADSLPAQGAARDREVRRLIDLQAAAEAGAALHSMAARSREGVVGAALTAADEILAGGSDAATLVRLRDAVSSPEFLPPLRIWIRELRNAASVKPETGACTIATALHVWSWTMNHFRIGEAARATAVDELSEMVVPLLAARALALEVAVSKDDALRRDLSHVYAAHVSANTGSACAELVYGYRRHLGWDAEGCAACYASDDLDDLEAIMPGIASGARTSIDVIEADGSHPAKEGPCVRFDGVDTFVRLRTRLDGCLTGARLARDRAAALIAKNT